MTFFSPQLFNVGVDKPTPVTGLEFERLPSQNLTEYRYFILATTPGFVACSCKNSFMEIALTPKLLDSRRQKQRGKLYVKL